MWLHKRALDYEGHGEWREMPLHAAAGYATLAALAVQAATGVARAARAWPACGRACARLHAHRVAPLALAVGTALACGTALGHPWWAAG